MSPTQRTLKACRDAGMTCQVVEKWNPFAKIRQDLFGFIDIVCMSDDGIVGVQATSGSNHNARIKKILSLDTYKKWLTAGGQIEVWSWKKSAKKGKRPTWSSRCDTITTYGIHRRNTD